MRKTVALITAALVIFLIWPNRGDYLPSCPYHDAMQCGLWDPSPAYKYNWFSGYRFIKYSVDDRMKITHYSRLEFDSVGRGGAEQFNFDSLVVLLLISVPVYIVALNRKLFSRRIKAVLR